MIEFKQISKKFKDTTVLKDISFEIEKGKLVVLIGLSGCGKTTTLKMINRLINATSGTITINGEDISKKNKIKLRRNIGYVIQQTGLFPHMTIRENIEIIARAEKRPLEEITKRTTELMGMGANKYVAIDNKETDVTDAFATDGLLRKFGLVQLEDDKNFFPPYYAVPLLRAGLLDEYPQIEGVLDELGQVLTNDIMVGLNYQVDELQKQPRQVANDFLKEQGLID